MKTVDLQTMKEVEGGGIKWALIGGIAGIITFLVGLFDGQIKLK